MDILVAVVACLVAKVLLFSLKNPRKEKTHNPHPLGVRLFGMWFYWILATRGDHV